MLFLSGGSRIGCSSGPGGHLTDLSDPPISCWACPRYRPVGCVGTRGVNVSQVYSHFYGMLECPGNFARNVRGIWLRRGKGRGTCVVGEI